VSLPDRGFPRTEYEQRAARAHGLMAALELDALLVCTEPEVRYLTGFHTPFWQSPTRPWFVVLPASGTPVAVIPEIGASAMAGTWLDDVRTWPAPRPTDDGLSLLVETLREVSGRRPGSTGRIGLPMGPETHVRMPLADLDALRDRIPPLDLVDATKVVRGLRMVKSDLEIRKVAHVCDVVSGAFEGIPDLLSTGMTEREAFAAFRVDLLQRGADDVPYLVGASGPGFDDIIKQPSDRVIGTGDLLMFDTGTTFDGYFCDFDRYVAFGRADDDAMRLRHGLGRHRGRPGRCPTGSHHQRPLAGHGPGARGRRATWELPWELRGSPGPRVGHAGHRMAVQHRRRRHGARRGDGADPGAVADLGSGPNDGPRGKPGRPGRRP